MADRIWGSDDMGEVIAQRAREAENERAKPYVVVLKNNTDVTIENVEILNSNEAIRNGLNSREGLSINYGLPEITYAQFLNSVSSGLVFQAGITRFIAKADVQDSKLAASLESQQVQQMVTVTTRNINGSQVQRPFIPTFDAYAYQTSIFDIQFDYLVTGTTSLVIARVMPHTELTVQFFMARQLQNGSRFRGETPWTEDRQRTMDDVRETDVKTILDKQQKLNNKELDKHLKDF